MGYCVSVEENVVHVCLIFDGKWPEVFEVFDVYAIRSSGIVVLFEMANCTCVVVSHISLLGRVLIAWSMCLLNLFKVTFMNCLLKAFALSVSVMAVLVLKQMLLFCCVVYFCWITLLWCPAGSVDCVCDQFCQGVASRCLFCVHVFVCLCGC